MNIQLSTVVNGQVVNYEIYDVFYGTLVSKSTAVADAGSIRIAEGSSLASGHYLIKTGFNAELHSVRVVKQ